MLSAIKQIALLLPVTLGSLAGGAAAEPAAGKPVFAVRELYAPGHFGNSYEVMGAVEMRKLLAEAVHWGFNRYCDWFDTEDCSDPFAEKRLIQLAHILWQHKKDNFRSAQSLGLACDLAITPNHVYVDQCTPVLQAVKGGRIFGQLICPSKPEARAIILKNYENLLADLARSGVRLSAICPCPYDFGGCGCKQCNPWILTYARLVKEIHAVALRYHPQVKIHMVGWWWAADEHRMFADWVDREDPGWVKQIFLHIQYGATDVSNVGLPRGCQRGAFVHVAYAEQSAPRDVYGHFGPVIAADRLQRTVADLAAHGATGVMAYSEGVLDDVNRAILAGLSSGKFRTSDEVLRAYAQRYFAADGPQAAQWAQWLRAWGRPFDVDPQQSAAALKSLLAGAPPGNWQRRQWELKLELFRLHRLIAQGKEWTPQRLARVDEFWAVHEEIQRGLWGLGALRHCFDRRYTPVSWYADWARHVDREVKAMGKEQ
jgi:hypothetical protein